MEKNILILILCISFSIFGQTKESDFLTFIKAGIIMKTCQICAFDMFAEILKEIDNKIYFIWEERLYF
jgi:hypothetical protein